MKRLSRKTLLYCAITLVTALLNTNAFAAEPDSENYRKGMEFLGKYDLDQAWVFLNYAEDEYPNNGYVFLGYSKAMELGKKHTLAYILGEAALEYMDPNDKEGVANALMNLGVLAEMAPYYGIHNRCSSEEFFDQAVEVNPDDFNTWIKRGVNREIVLHDHEGANADYRKAIEVAPHEALPYSHLGQSLHRSQNRIDEAIEVYRAACAAVKDYPRHHVLLAELLMKKGQYDEAAQVMLQAIDKVDWPIIDSYVLANFPKKQKAYLRKEIKKRAEKYPERYYWDNYLKELDK